MRTLYNQLQEKKSRMYDEIVESGNDQAIYILADACSCLCGYERLTEAEQIYILEKAYHYLKTGDTSYIEDRELFYENDRWTFNNLKKYEFVSRTIAEEMEDL